MCGAVLRSCFTDELCAVLCLTAWLALEPHSKELAASVDVAAMCFVFG
jgi:hypothetical protein